jgi:hypothetical protein
MWWVVARSALLPAEVDEVWRRWLSGQAVKGVGAGDASASFDGANRPGFHADFLLAASPGGGPVGEA